MIATFTRALIGSSLVIAWAMTTSANAEVITIRKQATGVFNQTETLEGCPERAQASLEFVLPFVEGRPVKFNSASLNGTIALRVETSLRAVRQSSGGFNPNTVVGGSFCLVADDGLRSELFADATIKEKVLVSADEFSAFTFSSVQAVELELDLNYFFENGDVRPLTVNLNSGALDYDETTERLYNRAFYDIDITFLVDAVPAPAPVALFGLGTIALAVTRRPRARRRV